MAKRLGLLALGAFCLLAGFVALYPPLYVSLFGPYPAEWMQVTPGMSSGEARRILGPPSADGRQLKSIDRWGFHQNGIYMELTLYIGQNEDDQSRVEQVWRKRRYFYDIKD